jgi:hypothetical protein
LLLSSACMSSPSAEGTPTPRPSASLSGPPSAQDGTGNRPPACLDAKLVWADSLRQLLLANCVDQSDLASVEQLWAWGGEAWELVDGEGPPANVVTGFGWDGDRDVLVRYGGIPLPSQECSPETWEWDTVEWRQVDAEPPRPCDHHELAWDASAGRMLLVGGGRGRVLVTGTWGWDGTAWTELTEAGPDPRAHHGLVFDEGHAQAFLYGGFTGSAVFDDLWSWDGSAWEELAIPGDGPGPRSHHGLAVSPTGLLLFGGATTASTFGSLVDETWLLTDGRWQRLDGPGPSARGLPAIGYDPDREVVVLYGGFGPDGAALADTWEWDGAWRCITGC